MAEQYVNCPLCGFEFEHDDTLCQHGCPMRTHCGLIRCPSCDYEFPAKPGAVSWFLRKLRRRGKPELDSCGDFRTVGDLIPGETSEVVSLENQAASKNTLAAFGLVPGSEVTLVQHRPACVVKVGETEIALDPEVAREIVVRRAEDTVTA